MFRNLLGIELSQLRFALMCSYVGGILLMATGLIFALPSIFIEALMIKLININDFST